MPAASPEALRVSLLLFPPAFLGVAEVLRSRAPKALGLPLTGPYRVELQSSVLVVPIGKLKLTVLSEDRLQMKWKEAEGTHHGYKVRVKPLAGVSEHEMMLKTNTAKATVAGLVSAQEYALQIFVLNGTQELLFAKRKFSIDNLREESKERNSKRNQRKPKDDSPTVSGNENGSKVVESPSVVLYKESSLPAKESQSEMPTDKTSKGQKKNRTGGKDSVKGEKKNKEKESQVKEQPGKTMVKQGAESSADGKPFICETAVPADIVILVDGSWSIGRSNFKRVREFLENLMMSFNIGWHKTRIALTQYSGDPRIEWNLNNFSSNAEIQTAVRNFRYKGGNTFTGLALMHVLEENLKAESGARPSAPQFVILVTDGKSQDDANAAAQKLKSKDIEIIAVGVKNADEAELKQIASEPIELNVFNVVDFHLLSLLVDRLARIVCGRIEERTKMKEAKIEILVPLSPPTQLQIYGARHNSLKVKWHPTEGATEYMVLYSPVNEEEPDDGKEVKLGPNETDVELNFLLPMKEYSVSVYALYGDEPSDPVTATAFTQPLNPPESQIFSEVTHSSVRVSWAPVSDNVNQYQVTYITNRGSDVKQHIVGGDQVSTVLEGVENNAEYQISLSAQYADGAQSEAVAARYSTFSRSAPANLVIDSETPTSFVVRWDHPNSHVHQYRVAYNPLRGEQTEQIVTVPGKLNSAKLESLLPETKYSVQVTAVYSNREEGSAQTQGKTSSLRVTSLKVYKSDHSSMCTGWKLSHEATSYRIVIESLKDKKTREDILSQVTNSHCFLNLEPDTVYRISIFSQLQSAEGDPVTVLHSTNVKKQVEELGATAAAPLEALMGFVQRLRRETPEMIDVGAQVHVAGRNVTVLLDPHSYDAVVMESSSKLDFNKYAHLLMKRIFDLQLPDHDSVEEKATMKICGYLTLFGNEAYPETSSFASQSSDVYKEFRKFDELLMKIVRASLTSGEKKEVRGIKERLFDLLSSSRLGAKLNQSSWLKNYRLHLVKQGVNEEMLRRAMLLQLWATQGNTGPAAFWLMVMLLKHPDALIALKDELNTFLKPKNDRQDPNAFLLSVSEVIRGCTPILDSTLNETLRMTAAPFITREILQNMTLTMADGQQYNLRKGERICLFPYLSPQMDPEVHYEPEKFKYNRFLNQDGSPKTDFFKGDKKLKYSNMPWGAGRNICVGRQFAINSIKQFIFIMLMAFDVELCDSEASLPEVDVSRYGFGMLQPKKDIKIRYRLKMRNFT
ncbi:PTGIS synthase, partial [Polypterus senegalus]